MSRASLGTTLHATPRGVDSIQDRPVYVPEPSAPIRPGANDAALIPSLRNGIEEAHKAPMMMTSRVHDFSDRAPGKHPFRDIPKLYVKVTNPKKAKTK